MFSAASQSSRLVLQTTRSLVVPSAARSSACKIAPPTRRTFTSSSSTSSPKKTGWWYSAELWGGFGALAGWGMSASAIWDAYSSGPEVISLTMTPVLIVYSSLFARWAWIVQPRNLLLCGCHLANIGAQLNQFRRAVEYKMSNGEEDEASRILQQAAIGGVLIAGTIVGAPTVRNMLTKSDYGVVSKVAAAPAGPFTVHFWAPMSKWMISGASFFDLQRPTDKISLPQYTALTLTGFFFSRYALLVTPINYALCSVNIALFGSSAWHMGRKVNADYLHLGTASNEASK
ncbi:pyruvate transporter mpc1 [Mayamaea pseudoterrestris]|nr:pyruvate transporter mpc1 [Mayamaea pseudoterrestris]